MLCYIDDFVVVLVFFFFFENYYQNDSFATAGSEDFLKDEE